MAARRRRSSSAASRMVGARQPEGEPELVDVHDCPHRAIGKAIPFCCDDDRSVAVAGRGEPLREDTRDLHHRRRRRRRNQRIPLARLEVLAAALDLHHVAGLRGLATLVATDANRADLKSRVRRPQLLRIRSPGPPHPPRDAAAARPWSPSRGTTSNEPTFHRPASTHLARRIDCGDC